MGLQKYRFDITEPADEFGVVELRSNWMGGTPIAGLRNCPCGDYGRRTVYVTGEPDTYFSIPAAIGVKGKRITGWIGHNDGKWEFHPDTAKAPDSVLHAMEDNPDLSDCVAAAWANEL